MDIQLILITVTTEIVIQLGTIKSLSKQFLNFMKQPYPTHPCMEFGYNTLNNYSFGYI